jgi:uncharacterized protein (TIGR03790 family)
VNQSGNDSCLAAAARLIWLLGGLLFANSAFAGGSRLNTVVVINAANADSVALGNYYCEARAIPAENIIRINWTGGTQTWTSNDFSTRLLLPLQEALVARALTSQITHLVLSMGIPFQTTRDTTNFNSTTAALFYGLKLDFGNDPGTTNSYAFSELPFPAAAPLSASSPSFLATMLTGKSLADAKALVDRGVTSDHTNPDKPVILAKSSDPNRNARHPLFDNAILNARLLGTATILRTNSDSVAPATNLFGYQTGLQVYSVASNAFAPGAIADSMTSFGGIIFGPNSQTNLLAFIEGGATGSYGTVAEPTADTNKFPSPMVYFYQARGFNLVESYYQCLSAPYLGLIVGEPLSAPFAQLGKGDWSSPASNSILTGTVSMAVEFHAHDSSRPLQQIDFFLDGKFQSAITNVAPAPGNLLNLSLNGYPVSYLVPTNATIANLTTGIAAALNNPTVTNATRIRAIASGDRIELQSIASELASTPFYVPYPTTPGLTNQVRYLPEDFPPQLFPAGFTKTDAFQLQLGIPNSLPCVIQASTNLNFWQPIYTNTTAGLIHFEDAEASLHPHRFYRLVGPVANQPPKISTGGLTGANTFRIQIESQPGQPCAILVSSNQQTWSGLITNNSGGFFNHEDTILANQTARFYRAWIVPPSQPTLSFTNLTPETTLLRIDQPAQPYRVDLSTNGLDWAGWVTNFAFREIQAEAESSIGSADWLSTYLRVSRPTFANSEAFGVQGVTFFAANMTIGAWAKFTFTKTNGAIIVLAGTNLVAGANTTNLAYQLYSLINATPALQDADGIVAEDYYVNVGGQAKFTLRARSPGLSPAQAGFHAEASGFATGVTISPGSYRRLNRNLADLQPRNHLYVTAGAMELSASFPLDTTQLADGYHELTVVAYEGSHVQTQTHATIPICISNSPLAATLTLLDPTNNAPANATYHIQVSANTNNVTLTTLYSTGGAIGFATNNPNATFDVIGTNLWTGRHPFYAIVETATGQKFRTQTSWIRLQ